MPAYTQKEKIEWKDIVIEVIRELSKKALVEFKGGYSKTIIKGDWSEEVYIPDSRKEYIQGVEFLSDLLLAEYDKSMKETYKKTQEEIEKALKDYEDNKKDKEEYVIIKLKLIRKQFQQMMIFLNRIKFFKKKVVGG